MQLVLDSPGLQITRKEGMVHIVSENGTRSISIGKLSSVAVTANVLLGTDFIRLAVRHEVPILFFDRIGKAKARLWSPYFASIATLRRQQVRFGDTPEATAWMVDIFHLKAEEQIRNLEYIRKQRGPLHLSMGQAINIIKQNRHNFDPLRDKLIEEARQPMMGVEGAIARVYWRAVGNGIPRKYMFQTRSRKPAKDIFNAALNYLYGMLYSVVEGALFAVGLDPHLGILHADEYDRPTLSFDLIEPFRPWIDRLLIEQCFHQKLDAAFFTKNQHGLFLNKTGKVFIIPLFNDFLRSEREYLNQNSTVKNHIYFLAGRLAQRIRITVG